MSDELTPEEREALDSLPRERMPAGLEARVVEAMREHGFLAKRRRAIELTNGRVAGVLAAGVALVIGAYSIGWQRGGNAVLLPATTVQQEDRYREGMPQEDGASKPTTPGAEKKDEAAAIADADALANAKSWSEAPVASPVVRSDEAVVNRAREIAAKSEALSSAPREPAASPAPSALSSQATAKRSDQPQRMALAEAPKTHLTILLDGVPMEVEADSARVSRDERGRILIIYTSDGTFRIRLAE